jgi:uncharacterized membrane protein (DUF4010 family)
VTWAQQRFGTLGLFGGTALAALADAHAPVAALAALQSAGTVDPATRVFGARLAGAANSATRCVAAFTTGGRGYGLAIALSLLLSGAVAGAVAVATR